jgi:hypothetical protein
VLPLGGNYTVKHYENPLLISNALKQSYRNLDFKVFDENDSPAIFEELVLFLKFQ